MKVVVVVVVVVVVAAVAAAAAAAVAVAGHTTLTRFIDKKWSLLFLESQFNNKSFIDMVRCSSLYMKEFKGFTTSKCRMTCMQHFSRKFSRGKNHLRISGEPLTK
jgi:hypothetical protein